jgi:hypothetical protein
MGPALLSLSATALLMGGSILLLALGVGQLRHGGGTPAAIRFLAPTLLNFALLVVGIRFLAHQDWFRPAYGAVGVAVPLLILAITKGSHGTKHS